MPPFVGMARQSLPRSSANAAGGDWHAPPRPKKKSNPAPDFRTGRDAPARWRHRTANPSKAARRFSIVKSDRPRRRWHGAPAMKRRCWAPPSSARLPPAAPRLPISSPGASTPPASRHHGNRHAPRAAARHRTDKAPVPPPPARAFTRFSFSATLRRSKSLSVEPSIRRQ